MVSISPRSLSTKLLRDLYRLAGQAITIVMVIACGVASYVALQGCYISLQESRDVYYSMFRFADLFVSLKHAPEPIKGRLEQIPGVAEVETRLVEPVLVPLENSEEPATGSVVSLPSFGEPLLNAVMLKTGRLPQFEHSDEALVLDSFVTANGLKLGDTLSVVMSGVKRDVRIVGTGQSPEYVFSAASGSLVMRDAAFVVLWMDRKGVEPLFRKEAAFDSALLRLDPGAQKKQVISSIDTVLAPYGGLGAYGRDLQASNRMVSGELDQLRSSAITVPTIFMAVAAFLVNVVLSRVVALHRPQIATLRALGYSSFEVGFHYMSLVLLIALVGGGVGVALGLYLGDGMMNLYRPYFRFHELLFHAPAALWLQALLISTLAGVTGGLYTVYSLMKLPPAEAMRPEAPIAYKSAPIENSLFAVLLGSGGNMILRELWRFPIRTSLSILGIAASVAVSMTARFSVDAIEVLRDLEFIQSHRETMQVSFRKPVAELALTELKQMPGVISVESSRTTAIRLRNGSISRDVGLTGHIEKQHLTRVLQWPTSEVPIPEHGIVLPVALANALGVKENDQIHLETMEGEHREYWMPVALVSEETVGLRAHVSLATLRRLLGEQGTITEAYLRVDPELENVLVDRLVSMPNVGAIVKPKTIIESFDQQTGASMGTTMFILSSFGAVLAMGIVYNNARVALSTRGRDLATLRVLGFTRAEISVLLLGELAVQVLLALPVGVLLGSWMLSALMSASSTEVYRLPPTFSIKTAAYAIIVTLCAALVSALLVRRKLDKLDLLETLKARE